MLKWCMKKLIKRLIESGGKLIKRLIKGCEALVLLGLKTNQTFDEQFQLSKDGRD